MRNCRDGGPNICSERAARHLSRGARDTSARRAVGNGFTFLPPWCLISTPGAVTRGSRRSGPVPVPYAARMESQDAELSGSVITFDDTVEEGAAAQPTPRSALSESAKNDFPTKESATKWNATVDMECLSFGWASFLSNSALPSSTTPLLPIASYGIESKSNELY